MRGKFSQNFKLGVLGGGQLGRMLIQSAVDFNLEIWVLDPDPQAPCHQLASKFVNGPITDYETVVKFGQSCDLVTIEIENVNTDALKYLESKGIKVYPQPEVIELIKDKAQQKRFFEKNAFPTAPFVEVENRSEIARHQTFFPAVNKLKREGYDGRGVQIVHTPDDLDLAFDAPGILEKLVDIKKEIAVIVARKQNGDTVSYPVTEMVFHPKANLVEYLFSPADLSTELEEEAQKLALNIIGKLDMVGLLAVEMFLDSNDQILVNELAPRTHNSGHHTIEANQTSQFEQHLRAILGLPLGDTSTIIPSAMVNLLGEPGFNGPAIFEGMEEVLQIEGVHIHLYGKSTTKPFRKMGHVTITGNDMVSIKEKIISVKHALKIKA